MTNKMDYQGKPSVLLALMALMAHGASKKKLMDRVDLSSAVIERYIRSLREDWGCEIKYSGVKNEYLLTSAGVFNSPAPHSLPAHPLHKV